MTAPLPIRKVAILGTMPPIRALSSYCFELSRAVAEMCQVEFISFKKIYPSFLYPGGKLEDDDTYPPVEHTTLHVKRRIAWYNPLSWFMEGIATKADLLHAQWWSLPLFPIYLVISTCFAFRRKPVVFTVHNVLPHEKSFFFTFFSRILFSFGSHFIVHSETNRRQMVSYYGVSEIKVSVIPHGSLDFHIRKNADRNEARERLNIDQKDKIILLFGAVRPYKGIDVALDAMPEIIKHIPDARLLVAGKLWEDWTPYEKRIYELKMEGHVYLHLHYIPSNEVYLYFEAADLVILPYRHFDSQSGAGAAAVSFQKPMIVSNVGGLPELVPDDDMVIPADDPAALADKVVKYLGDPEKLKYAASRTAKISEQLNWADIARQTVTVYEKLLQ